MPGLDPLKFALVGRAGALNQVRIASRQGESPVIGPALTACPDHRACVAETIRKRSVASRLRAFRHPAPNLIPVIHKD